MSKRVVKETNGVNVKLAIISTDIQYIKQEIHDLRTLQQNSYVTKEEFSPVKKVVYGLVGLILVAVGGALINVIIQN